MHVTFSSSTGKSQEKKGQKLDMAPGEVAERENMLKSKKKKKNKSALTKNFKNFLKKTE